MTYIATVTRAAWGLRTFAAERRMATWICGYRTVSEETSCVACNLTGVWRITFKPQRPILKAGLRQHCCLIRRTHRTMVRSVWPLLLKCYQSKINNTCGFRKKTHMWAHPTCHWENWNMMITTSDQQQPDMTHFVCKIIIYQYQSRTTRHIVT